MRDSLIYIKLNAHMITACLASCRGFMGVFIRGENMKEYPSQEYLNSIFEYRDGGLYRLTGGSGKNKQIGNKAGCHNKYGYRVIKINGTIYKEHRLIWIYHYGEIQGNLFIDHINRIRDDNRIENLRLVNRSLNQMNSDGKNVIFIKNRKSPYLAYYYINGKQFSKRFATEQEAREWVDEKKSEIFQEWGLTWTIPVIE